MRFRTTHLAAALATLGLTLSARPARALVTVYEKDQANLQIGALIQPQLILTQDGNATGDGIGIDPFIRRARLMMGGKLNDTVNFFIETDNANFGKDGVWTTDTYVQDAWVEFNLGKPLRIDAGMLLMPFSRHAYQGAGSLLTMDYHGSMIKYGTIGKTWRDAGVMARGQLLDDKLDYRLAITNGIETFQDTHDDGTGVQVPYDDAINPSDLPRVMGRLNVNLFESDEGPGVGGFFADGIYLKENENGKLISAKKMLSIGAALDFQSKAVRNGDDLANWMGVAGDVFWDLPMGDKKHSLNGQVNYAMYNFGEGNAANGMGLWGDVGYRIKRVQPLVALEWWNTTENDTTDFTTVLGGVNWWIMGHSANLKFQGGATRIGDGDFTFSAGMQSQLAF